MSLYHVPNIIIPTLSKYLKATNFSEVIYLLPSISKNLLQEVEVFRWCQFDWNLRALCYHKLLHFQSPFRSFGLGYKNQGHTLVREIWMLAGMRRSFFDCELWSTSSVHSMKMKMKSDRFIKVQIRSYQNQTFSNWSIELFSSFGNYCFSLTK